MILTKQSKVYVVQGDAALLEGLYDDEFLENIGDTSHSPCWTCPQTAEENDLMLIYLMRPISAIVGSARIASEPFMNTDRNSRWFGKKMVVFEDLKMLNSDDFLPLWKMNELFPHWQWTRRPQGAVRVPQEYKDNLLAFLRL